MLWLHITASVGWVGAVFVFLPFAVVAMTSTEDLFVRSAFIGMKWILDCVIVPSALLSLLTGLVSSLGTPWGLVRHYWVLVKLVLTLFTLVVLAVQVRPIHQLAERAADPSMPVVHLAEAPRPLIHACGGLVFLLLIQGLGVFKPKGVTRYGVGRSA